MPFLVFLLAIFPFSSHAQNTEINAGLPAGVYFEAFFSMIFILSLLVLVAWLLRKVTKGKNFGAGINVIGGVALGPRERVILLEVGEECLVVGIVPGQIRTLHHLPKAELKNLNAVQPHFADYLSQLSKRFQK